MSQSELSKLWKMTEGKVANGFGRKIVPNSKGKEIVVYEAPDGSNLASFDEIIKYLTSAGKSEVYCAFIYYIVHLCIMHLFSL